MAGPQHEYIPRPSGGLPPLAGFDGPHEELFDWQKARLYITFSLGSVRRRPGLFLAVLGGMVAVTATALAVLPKTYQVQSRLLVQRNAVLASRGDANADQPTRAAAEMIVRTDNLHALIGQTQLVKEWPKRRAPILRLKDWMIGKLDRAATDSEQLDGLTGLLEKNLAVWTTPDGTVDIRLNWPDGLMAYRLVDAATQNFLERRHILEVSTISEQVGILEMHAGQLQKDVEKQVAALIRLRERAMPKRSRQPARPQVAMAPRMAAPEPEALNIKVLLESKRRAIADLEEMRRRHVIELQTRLTEQRVVYSSTHPAIIDLEQSILSLRQDSPQLVALRHEEAELRIRFLKYTNGAELVPGVPTIPAELFRVERDMVGNEDPSVEYARAELRFTLSQSAAMRERISAARIDLDTAQAAFKYRYSVVLPPEVPRGPIKPKAALIMAAAVIAGLMLALFATTAVDLRSGVVYEPWQLKALIGASQPIVVVRFP